MVSAVEQMAANTSWSALGKATELRKRILFTLGLLLVYRLGTFIPVPGIDATALREFMESAQSGIGGMLSMFTGGALGRMGIFALGIMPYISASIIVQLLTSMVPSLEQLKKEGEQGRRKINQYTRYGTVLLATFQAYGLASSLEAGDLVTDPGLFFRLSCMITLVGGTMFLMWLGEQITARGIGNGISLIIFVGIIAELPAALAQFFASGRSGAISPAVIVGVIVMVVACDRVCCVHGTCTAQGSYPIPTSPSWHEGDGRAKFAPSDQGKPSRRYSRDLRIITAFAAYNNQHRSLVTVAVPQCRRFWHISALGSLPT
jgi:preprotein translocase subunit SecY